MTLPALVYVDTNRSTFRNGRTPVAERPLSLPSWIVQRLRSHPSALVTLRDTTRETASMEVGQRSSISTVAQLALVPITTRRDFARLIPT